MRARLFISAVVLTLVAMVLATTGCSGTENEAAAAAPSSVLATATIPAGDKLAATPDWLSRGINNLGFDVLNEMRPASGDENTLLSPLALHSSLALASLAANDEAVGEFNDVLGLEGHSPDEVGAAYANLLARVAWVPPMVDKMGDGSTANAHVATSLWADAAVTPSASFLKDAVRYYGAEVRTIDLQDPGAPVAIGDWVARQSGGTFAAERPRVANDTGFQLASTLLFQSAWAKAFPSKNTSEGVFTTRSGKRRPMPFMGDHDEYYYAENDKAQLVRLPYATDALWILLPREGVTTDDLLAEYDAARFGRMREVALAVHTPGSISLPRVQTRSSNGERLSAALKDMGLDAAFERGAFPDIDEGAQLDSLRHEVTLSVNETGTLAGSYTEMGWGVGACDVVPPKPFEMRVDRPFLILLESAGRDPVPLLFLGEINDPGTAE